MLLPQAEMVPAADLQEVAMSINCYRRIVIRLCLKMNSAILPIGVSCA